MPIYRKRRTEAPNPHKVPADEIRPVSVSQPEDLLNIFRQFADKRRHEVNEYVPLRILYEEAVEGLINDLQAGCPIRFVPTPATGTVRRTIWIDEKTMKKLKETADRNNLRYATFALTALLRYAARYGVTFEGFPSDF